MKLTEFAVIIKKLVGCNNKIRTVDAVEDDPQRRKPDITRAMTYLNWKPKVSLFDLCFLFYCTSLTSILCLRFPSRMV